MREKANKKRYQFYLISILIVLSLGLNISSAQISINNSEKVEAGILNELNTSRLVRVIVDVDSKNSINSIVSQIPETEIKFKREMAFRNAFVAEITKPGLEVLINNSYILKISLDKIAHTLLQQSLPLINATQVWAEGYTGKGQTVCVIDSGINYSHPDLGGCFGAGCKVIGGYDYVNNDADPMDDFHHGTHVAGIAAAKGKINGTAPDAKLVAMKACNQNGSCFTSDIEDSLGWCTANRVTYNISIISISIGDNNSYSESNCPSDLGIEINNATYYNISVIVASGNNNLTNGVSWPACRGNATSVGAVYDSNIGFEQWCTQRDSIGNCIQTCTDFSTFVDKITCFTNRGGNLDLLAPGSVINSTWINGFYAEDSGTSMAAPHVAGAAAILLQRDPTLTPDEIRTILQNTGKGVYDTETGLTFKRIDILNATNSLCTCTSWQSGSCGVGGCLGSQRYSNRTCNPAGCEVETKCEFDVSCGPGPGKDITVCQNGSCNYTSIQTALIHSGANDKIYVKDNVTYAEELVMNSTSSPWLYCEKGAKISMSAWRGIFVNNVDGPVIVGCYISNFDYGIYVNSSYGLFENNTITNNQIGIYLYKAVHSNKIKRNNITKSSIYAVQFYGSSWGDSPSYNIIEENIIEDNDPEAIYIRFGQYNEIKNNNLSESTNYGIYIEGYSMNSFSTIENNIIYKNGDKGLYNYNSNLNTINSNKFCPSNTNVDIDIASSTSISGDNNRCEKPGSWNDAGTTGCTYYCDNPPIVTLLYPPDGFTDADGNVDFTCQATDDYKLVNITLYHNIIGTWQANQTKNISGTSNITTFYVNDIVDKTIFIWNCLAYDNKSRGSFAGTNWTINVTTPPDNPPTVTLVSPANNSVDEDGTVIFNCSATDDYNLVNITLYGNWSGNWLANETKNLSGTFNSTTFTKNLDNGIYKWNCLAYDNASQGDWGDSNWTVNVSIVDTQSPIYSNLTEMPADPAIYSAGQFYEFNITWTDDGIIDTVWIEFNGINYTNEVYNIGDVYSFNRTGLAVGTYYYIWYANDSAGNQNNTEQQSYTINKTNSQTSLIFDKTSPQTYGIQINASCKIITGIGNVVLYRNGLDVTSSENGKLITLSAETHNYNCSLVASQNYTASENISSFTINKVAGNISLLLNSAANNLTIQYPTQSNISSSTLYGSVTIYRNSVDITSENNLNLIRGAGYYNITAVSSGDQNHSSASITKWLNITRTGNSLNLTSSAGWTYNYGTSTTLECTSTYGTPNLFKDNVSINNPATQAFGAGTYTIKCNITESQNYTSNSTQQTLTINQAIPTSSLSALPSWTATYGTETNVSCSYTESEVTAFLFKNNVAVSNPHIAILGAGIYNYTCNNTATQNYTVAQTSNILIINQTSSEVNLLLNGTDGNVSVYVGKSVNITAILVNGTGNIQVYNNGSLIYSGSSPSQNITTYNNAGTYNITAIYSGNQNYTSSFETHYVSVSAIIIPNDTYKFYIKNNTGGNVAWFGNLGNIVLKGICNVSSVCTAPQNSFIIANSTDNTTAYIDNQGNLCIEKGDCSDQSASCNPTKNAFIIRNSTNYNMSYIDFDGDLCLTGKLYENSNP